MWSARRNRVTRTNGLMDPPAVRIRFVSLTIQMDTNTLVSAAAHCNAVSIIDCNAVAHEVQASDVPDSLKSTFFVHAMLKLHHGDATDGEQYIKEEQTRTQRVFEEAQRVHVDDIVTDGGRRDVVLKEKCPKCGFTEQWMVTVQRRGVDEGANVELECKKCKFKWSHRG